jgi:hypothetical protein
LLSILVLDLNRLQSGNLELLTIGLLGVILGYIPLEKINGFIRHPYLLITAYLCYIYAITIWNALYPLQIVGVCLSLALLYLLGSKSGEPGRARSQMILLGKYSLLGYIAQIAILQLLRRGLLFINAGHAIFTLVLSFLAVVALTMIAVVAVDRARARLSVVDGLYKSVFA